MMGIGKGVISLVKTEAAKASIKKPMVVIIDCGCIMNQESVVVDIREERDEAGLEPYLVHSGVRFLVSPKVRHIADKGSLETVVYGGGRFKRLELSPKKG